MASMPRAKLLFLSMVAVLSAVTLSAPWASAHISFEWFVGGNLLAAGETRTFDLDTDGHTFDLHSSIAGSVILLLSNKINVEKGLILGGRPGTNEETLVFENVTSDSPANCTVESLPKPESGKLRTKVLKSEIVEGEGGEVLMVFAPKEGTIFATLLFLGTTCPVANIPENLEGTIAGLPLPQKAEVLRQDIDFLPDEISTLTASGATINTRLTLANETAVLGGLSLFLLTSDAVWGPF
jgi:hypothetical protein